MAENKTEQILVHLEYLREGMDGVNARLDAQNGRLRKCEMSISVLQWAISLIGAGAFVALGVVLHKVF